jgi:hypothetical protein
MPGMGRQQRLATVTDLTVWKAARAVEVRRSAESWLSGTMNAASTTAPPMTGTLRTSFSK